VNNRKTITRISSNSTDGQRLVDLSSWAIVTCCFLVVLVTTLFPFDFTLKENFSFQIVAANFHHPSNLNDWLKNILLFFPFGLSFTGLIQKTKLGFLRSLLLVSIASAGLSLTVEVLQVFLPDRSPTISDLASNSLGGLLGFICFHFLRPKITEVAAILLKTSRTWWSTPIFAVAFVGYIILSFLLTIALQNSTNLSNWNSTFPLLLGNEATGDRPWQGFVSEVYIADRAISGEEVTRLFTEQSSFSEMRNSLVASYRFTDQANYPDRTKHLRDLSWQGLPSDVVDSRGVFLNSDHWLATSTSAALMTQKIRKTSQFTLSATVATANITQTGPARIVSLSGSPYDRNFTLGQEGTHLVFRLRTPITGDNGINPELVIPDVFTDTGIRHLIISYDGSSMRFYVNKVDNLYSLSLTPEVTVFRYFLVDLLHFDNWKINLKKFHIQIYKLLYYGIIFIPLGVFLAFIAQQSKGRFVFYLILGCGGILLPSVILEGILASGIGQGMRVENLLLSMAMTTSTMLLVKSCLTSTLLSHQKTLN